MSIFVKDSEGNKVLPRPASTYADHSYPAYSKAQMLAAANAVEQLEFDNAALRSQVAELQAKLTDAQDAASPMYENNEQEPVAFGLWEYNDDSTDRESLAQRVFPAKEWAHDHINEVASTFTLQECMYTKWPTVIPLYAKPINLPALIEQAKTEERETVKSILLSLYDSINDADDLVYEFVNAIRARKP